MQSVDEYNTMEVDKEKFKMGISYMKAFHLSDSQVKRLFEHFMNKDTKKLNYMAFAKAIAGPPNQNRLNKARDVLTNLAALQKKTVTKLLGKNDMVSGEAAGAKMAPIYNLPSLGATLDMNNFYYKFNIKRKATKSKEEFI